jgi:hypothetical protein
MHQKDDPERLLCPQKKRGVWVHLFLYILQICYQHKILEFLTQLFTVPIMRRKMLFTLIDF